MEYRKEVDGLRALAVLPVILFHAGFGAFKGGYVGVDVFFVISGHLITTILLMDLDAERMSLVTFYERRARRILPALFLVMAVCVPFAWLWLIPQDLKSFSQSLVAVSLYGSNLLFWKTSNYFESAAELKPLLHTWSLAVEEQFYLLFPLFLMAAWRLGRRWVFALLTVVAILSLAVAQWGAWNAPVATFYLLPARAFELVIGAMVALHTSRSSIQRPRGKVAEIGSLVGLALLLSAMLMFDKATPFPSLYALVPTLGTAAILLFASSDTRVGRLLGHPALVSIGLISYSAYLWHQPLFAFARHRSMAEPSSMLFGALAVMSLGLAYLSWKFVEAPFRDRQRVGRSQILAFGVVGSLAFIAIGWTGHVNQGFESRLTDTQRRLSAFSNYDYRQVFGPCFVDWDQTYRDFPKACGETSGVPGRESLIWGDSYAASLSAGLRSVVNGGLWQYTASSCPPVIDTDFVERRHCREVNGFVLAQVARIKPVRVYLHANWSLYDAEAAVVHVGRTVDAIRKVSPASQIIIVGGLPMWTPTLPLYALRKGITLDNALYLPNGRYMELKALDGKLEETARMKGAEFLSALDQLCRSDGCLAVTAREGGFELTSGDAGHLTEPASMYLAHHLLAHRSAGAKAL